MKTSIRPIALALLYLFLGTFLLYPISFVFTRSFISDGKPSLAFFRILFSSQATLNYFLRSVNIGIAVTILASLIGIFLALITARVSFKGKTLVQGILFLPMILPPFIGALGMRKLFSRFGPINLALLDFGIIDQPIDILGAGGFWGVVITEALHLFPLIYLNVHAALLSFDSSLEEAAYNVGASHWTVLRRITLPLLAPSYLAGATLVFVWAFTDLGTPLLFELRDVLPVQVYQMLDEIHGNATGYALVTAMMLVSAGGYYFSQLSFGKSPQAASSKGVARKAQRSLSTLQLVGVYAVVGVLGFLSLLPHLGILLLSFSGRWFMEVLPSEISLRHFGEVVSRPSTLNSLKNSLFLSFGSTLLDLLLGLSIAYFLVRTTIRSKKLLDTISMLPLAVPGIVVAFGYVGCFAGTILDPRVNPMPLLILGYATRRLPFMLRTLAAGFHQSSIQLEQAAQNVGASTSRVFTRITLPLLLPHLAAGAILCFSFAMLEVSESIILAMEEKYYPITKAMYALLARPDGAYTASALGVLSMFFIAVCLLTARKLLGSQFGQVFRA